jgi:hypothetical protein
MKPRHLVAFALLSLSILAALSSCDLFGISIQNRISQFVADLNSSRGNLNNDISNSSLDKSAGVLDATWWDTTFPPPGPLETQYSITLTDYSDPSNVTGTILGPQNYAPAVNIRFVMVKDGADYFIKEIYLAGSGTATLKRLK